MARDRKRAKQRRDRAAAASRRGGSGQRGADSPAQQAKPPEGDGAESPNGAGGEQHDPGVIHRADLPGALEHAGAEADEFDAALVRGAHGVPDPISDAPERLTEREIEQEAEDEGDISENQLQELAAPGGGGAQAVTPAQASGAPLRRGNRALGFLRASWAELQRVQWPDRRQVTQATAVVIGFVAIAGAYLGVADVVAKEIVEFIL